MIHITHIRMAGGDRHEHIAEVQWWNPQDSATGRSTRETMVAWIRAGGDARVETAQSSVEVVVVDANPPYIRTRADGTLTDNLLSLPRY
jgi:hypothetical protein